MRQKDSALGLAAGLELELELELDRERAPAPAASAAASSEDAEMADARLEEDESGDDVRASHLVWAVSSLGALVTLTTPPAVQPAQQFQGVRSAMPSAALEHARATGAYVAITTVEFARGDVVDNLVVLAARVSPTNAAAHVTIRDGRVYVLVMDAAVSRLKAYQLVASHSIAGTLQYALRKREVTADAYAEQVSAAVAARWAEVRAEWKRESDADLDWLVTVTGEGAAAAANPNAANAATAAGGMPFAPAAFAKPAASLGFLITNHDGVPLGPHPEDVALLGVDEDDDAASVAQGW